MQGETIAAISTPMGAGGIGVVRLSGTEAIQVADAVFRSVSGKALCELRGYRGLLGTVMQGSTPVDEAIAYVYHAPRSYTGEDVVELSCHGGTSSVQAVLRLCLDRGARAAGPGEFTKRAYLNGKLDLTQAEAVMDIIGAGGEAALRSAVAAKGGRLSRELGAVAEGLITASAGLAAWTDYPEEGLEDTGAGDLRNALYSAVDSLERLCATYDQGVALRHGIPCVLAGKPNVGKSTLMNLLAGRSRSIVTDIPGTTRDVVEEEVLLGDYRLVLADTAGVRHTDNPVESIGVDLAWERVDSSQLVLAVFDGSRPLDQEDRELLTRLKNREFIAIINKSDLVMCLQAGDLAQYTTHVVELSAKDGMGRKELEEALLKFLRLDRLDAGAALVANERQRQGIRSALCSLGEAIQALESGVTLDAVGVCMEEALDHLLTVTGERASERIVDEVFSQFCVGK